MFFVGLGSAFCFLIVCLYCRFVSFIFFLFLFLNEHEDYNLKTNFVYVCSVLFRHELARILFRQNQYLFVLFLYFSTLYVYCFAEVCKKSNRFMLF